MWCALLALVLAGPALADDDPPKASTLPPEYEPKAILKRYEPESGDCQAVKDDAGRVACVSNYLVNRGQKIEDQNEALQRSLGTDAYMRAWADPATGVRAAYEEATALAIKAAVLSTYGCDLRAKRLTTKAERDAASDRCTRAFMELTEKVIEAGKPR